MRARKLKRLLQITWRSSLRRARQAARFERWSEASRHYRKHLKRYPQDAAAWVQFGHTLKEQGLHEEAVLAYRQIVLIQPEQVEAWVYLAHALRATGHLGEAVDTLSQGLSHNSAALRLADEMVLLGARDHLPLSIKVAAEQKEGHYTLARYAHYITAQPAPGDMVSLDHPSVMACIDARGADPSLVAASREKLGSRACFILTDSVDKDSIVNLPSSVTHLLLMEAGCRIEPETIDRFYRSIEETGASAAYGDHDNWRSTDAHIVRENPCFQPMHDPLWFGMPDVCPPCMMIACIAIDTAMSWDAIFDSRMALPVTYAHVPMLLASRWRGGELAAPAIATSPALVQGDIQVIIQTRDAPAMLERCVTSLLESAAEPDLLKIVIMDNRSTLPETAALLAKWEAQGVACIIPHDEPFNWARANNRAVGLGQASHLLFLNNDVQMESQDWDLSLRRYLAQPDVGAVGALLLYPNRMIQHAGVIFGIGEGGPLHEGVGRPTEPGGPSGRWIRPRLASAVTGAWLATSRTMFETVGGFDESLPVAFNDIEFCLRCRAADHLIVQASDIQAVHHESATRGKAPSSAVALKEQAEWARLRVRWGDALDHDPAYNPHWLRSGIPFDGFVTPSQEAVARWTKASARPRPWSILASVSS